MNKSVPNTTKPKPTASNQRKGSQLNTRLHNQIVKVLAGVNVAALVADANFLTATPEELRAAIVKSRVNCNQNTRGYSQYYEKAFLVFSKYPNSLQ